MYSVSLNKQAIKDIQKAIDYFESKSSGLGDKFELEIDEYIKSLERSPLFQIRYGNIRCLPLKKFHFMIHFRVDLIKKHVFVEAIIHTSQDPRDWLSSH